MAVSWRLPTQQSQSYKQVWNPIRIVNETRPQLAPGVHHQPRLPTLHGPSSVSTCLGDSDTAEVGENFVGERALVGYSPNHPTAWMYTSIRTKKKRGKKEVVHKNAEQQETKAS